MPCHALKISARQPRSTTRVQGICQNRGCPPKACPGSGPPGAPVRCGAGPGRPAQSTQVVRSAAGTRGLGSGTAAGSPRLTMATIAFVVGKPDGRPGAGIVHDRAGLDVRAQPPPPRRPAPGSGCPSRSRRSPLPGSRGFSCTTTATAIIGGQRLVAGGHALHDLPGRVRVGDPPGLARSERRPVSRAGRPGPARGSARAGVMRWLGACATSSSSPSISSREGARPVNCLMERRREISSAREVGSDMSASGWGGR